MLKIIWRTLLILGTAIGLSVLFYHAVNAGWLPGIGLQPVFEEDRRLNFAFADRSGLRDPAGTNRNVFPFRSEFNGREFNRRDFDRDFRTEGNFIQGLAEVVRNLGLIALTVIGVTLINAMLRLRQRKATPQT